MPYRAVSFLPVKPGTDRRIPYAVDTDLETGLPRNDFILRISRNCGGLRRGFLGTELTNSDGGSGVPEDFPQCQADPIRFSEAQIDG